MSRFALRDERLRMRAVNRRRDGRLLRLHDIRLSRLACLLTTRLIDGVYFCQSVLYLIHGCCFLSCVTIARRFSLLCEAIMAYSQSH